MTARYAVYFAPPPHSVWWQFGAHWLGRDEGRDVALLQPELAGISPEVLHSMTAEPRRYGFHATLKAPFGLRAGCTVAELQGRLRAHAKALRPVDLGHLHPTVLGNFVALVPGEVPEALMELAASCVTNLDDLRRPLTAEDVARRQPAKLDARALELLHQFGYPYVMERFRLHFSLTSPVTPSHAKAVVHAVQDRVAQLNATEPLVLDRLCLFVDPGNGHAFTRMADMELGA